MAAIVAIGTSAHAQQAAGTADRMEAIPLPEPSTIPLHIGEDRGYAALEQDLKRLGTTASVLMIVAHPDDEDGALLTYLSRGLPLARRVVKHLSVRYRRKRHHRIHSQRLPRLQPIL